jgi:uncharacterized membrane protein HdeD (DUF308 family)
MPTSIDRPFVPPDRHGLDRHALERLYHRWGWIVLFGAVVAFLGLSALILVGSATIVSVFMIAVFIIIAGGGEMAMGLSARDWGHFFLWIIAGLFYVAAGAFALAQPFVAAAVFTLALGMAMLATGFVRIYFGFRMAKTMRGFVILAGAVTSLVGLMIILGWPANSLFILGILLGLDLLFWGFGWIAFGLRLRAHAHHNRRAG